MPALARYKPWIDDLRKEKPYQLEEKLERLFHEKAITSHGAWSRLFNETMTALRFEVDGEPEPLALEPTLNFLMHPDERKRQAAAEALAKVFKDNVRLFTLITNTLAKDKEISDRWRGFKDVADSRHLANRVEREVVDALVGAVRAAYPRTAHRYYAMKAKWLGKEKLAYWDRNAPLPDKPERVVPGPTRRRSCSRPTAASRRTWRPSPSGSSTAPGSMRRCARARRRAPSRIRRCRRRTPTFCMNYQGKPRDVMTLAHELGHGVHQVLAAPQGALLAPTPLTLAETASVFGEMLTFRALLETATDAKRAQGAAGPEGRGHDQHGRAPDRLLLLRAQGARGAPGGRADAGAARADLARGAGREPGPGDRAQGGLRDLLVLHPALHPFAVLRLRLRLRRLPRELALRALPRTRIRASWTSTSTC